MIGLVFRDLTSRTSIFIGQTMYVAKLGKYLYNTKHQDNRGQSENRNV